MPRGVYKRGKKAKMAKLNAANRLPQQPPRGDKRKQIEALLRANPDISIAELAAQVGCSTNFAGKIRRDVTGNVLRVRRGNPHAAPPADGSRRASQIRQDPAYRATVRSMQTFRKMLAKEMRRIDQFLAGK